MAEKEQKDKNLPPRDFIDALVEDPASPPQVQVLLGYRGRSAQEGHARFYVDLALTAWADVPEDAILFQRESQDELGLSRSLVWVRLDAKVQIGPQAGGGTGAEFLQGQVAKDLGGNLGSITGGIGTLRTPLFVCPTQPPICIVPTQSIQCIPSLLRPCISLQIPCPTRDPNQCVLQTADPQQCPSVGITCTALPPCPPRTVPPACPPTPGIACIPSVLIACPPITQDPQQCVLQTQSVIQCGGGIPQPTSNPQLCPVATPNPGCVPGFPGGPGGIQTPQVLTTSEVRCEPVSSICPSVACPIPPDLGTQPFEAQAMGGAGFNRNIQAFPHTSPAICLSPVTSQWSCQIITNQPQCWITRIRLLCEPIPQTPVTVTFPTTPQLGNFGGFAQGAQGFQGAAQVAATQVAACTQFCPQPSVVACPVTFNCPPTQNQLCPITTNPNVCGIPRTLANCPTLNPVCPPLTSFCGGGF